MNLTQLKNRFQFYAEKHVDIKHTANREAFFHFDFDDLASAIKSRTNFPCMVYLTPEVEKNGPNVDGLAESFDCTFMILKQVSKNASVAERQDAVDTCKSISDDIERRIMYDVYDEIFGSAEIEQSQGVMAGPILDNLWGWSLALRIKQGFDAEINPDKWEDIE